MYTFLGTWNRYRSRSVEPTDLNGSRLGFNNSQQREKYRHNSDPTRDGLENEYDPSFGPGTNENYNRRYSRGHSANDAVSRQQLRGQQQGDALSPRPKFRGRQDAMPLRDANDLRRQSQVGDYDRYQRRSRSRSEEEHHVTHQVGSKNQFKISAPCFDYTGVYAVSNAEYPCAQRFFCLRSL